jgi:hypothetical protein
MKTFDWPKPQNPVHTTHYKILRFEFGPGLGTVETTYKYCRSQEVNAPDMSNHKNNSQKCHHVVIEVTMMVITSYHNNKPDEAMIVLA